jgi:hypothetical protein
MNSIHLKRFFLATPIVVFAGKLAGEAPLSIVGRSKLRFYSLKQPLPVILYCRFFYRQACSSQTTKDLPDVNDYW